MFIVNNQGFCQTYISLAPSLTNTAGTIADKSNIAVEVGKQWDAFSVGLAFGKSTLSKVTGRDTSNYLEIRPNLNVFQQGKFTNTFTAGIGYIFQAEENLLTEVTYGIEYSLTENVHFNVNFGQFFYSGKESASNVSFFGVSAVYFFTPKKLTAMFKPNQSKKEIL
jgi:hypothetical protein